MHLERIGWRRVSDAEDADPDRRAEMMRDAKQGVDALNRLSRGAPSPPPNGLRTSAIKRQRRVPPTPPDGLRTPDEAARKLGCSVKTLNAHVAAGALRYVDIGHGKKRRRIRFTDADINQTRKDLPCPSTRTETVGRRISTSTSKCEVIGFTARRNARRAAKPKK
jgi:excisionase family DNA binding protein